MNELNLKGSLRVQSAEERAEQAYPRFCSEKRTSRKLQGSLVAVPHASVPRARILPASRATNCNFLSLPPSRPRPSPGSPSARRGRPPERWGMWGAGSGDQRGVLSSWCCAIPFQQAAQALTGSLLSPTPHLRAPLAHPPSFPLLPVYLAPPTRC